MFTPETQLIRQDEYHQHCVPPKHASTMPPTSSGADNTSLNSPIADVEKLQQCPDATERTNSTLVPDEPSPETATSQPRMRKAGRLLKKIHFGKGEKEDAQKGKRQKSKNGHPFTFWGQVKSTLFNSWINLLLIMAPVGIALHFTTVNPVVIFVVNFIAIIPLAAMLSYATEEIALRTTETIGGLLNATFG